MYYETNNQPTKLHLNLEFCNEDPSSSQKAQGITIKNTAIKKI